MTLRISWRRLLLFVLSGFGLFHRCQIPRLNLFVNFHNGCCQLLVGRGFGLLLRPSLIILTSLWVIVFFGLLIILRYRILIIIFIRHLALNFLYSNICSISADLDFLRSSVIWLRKSLLTRCCLRNTVLAWHLPVRAMARGRLWGTEFVQSGTHFINDWRSSHSF